MLGTIWFFLWGLLWILYFITDGFDLGVGTLRPFLAKTEEDKRILLNSMGPFWDGNEVWLIAAGGVTFAAFPGTYAAMFSGLYTALMLLLFALIIRGVSLEFRGKIENPGWKKLWDLGVFFGSLVPALLLGVAFANIFKGLPLDAEGIFQGGLVTLLNPYGLLGGVLFVLLFAQHGSLWLCIKTQGPLQERAVRTASRLWPATLAAVLLFVAASFPASILFENYLAFPPLFLLLLLPVGGLLGIRRFLAAQRWWAAWASSAGVVAGCALFGLVGIFPALLPSSLNTSYSLTVANSSSSPLTLKIMLIVALIFVPIVLAYQVWTYKTFSHSIGPEDLSYEESY